MTLFIFLIILSVLILIHEFGHFIVAKWSGVRVEEFALGFPPCIASRKIGETRYSLNALPIGGYVRLFGEDEPPIQEQSSVQGRPLDRSFYNKPLGVKLAVALAGALMNLLLGVLAFSVLYGIVGIPTSLTNYPIIVAVSKNSPAEISDLKPFDRVLKVGDKEVKNDMEVAEAVRSSIGREVTIEVDRTPVTHLANLTLERSARETIVVRATPRVNPGPNEGPLGVALDTISITKTTVYPPLQMVPKAVARGMVESLRFAKQVLFSMGDMVRNLVIKKEVPQDVSGPVGIFQIVDVVAKTGILPLLSLAGILSINLAVINTLPFPGLDGARAFFILIHAVTRRKIAPVIEKNIHLVGLAVLLLLVLLISIRDVLRFF